MLNNLLKVALKGAQPRVVALDPGETTGACYFLGPDIQDARQIATKEMPLAAVAVREYIQDMFGGHGPLDAVVIEEYRVYSWKAEDHSWQSMHTSRLIGAVQLICHDKGVPLFQQSAQNAKGFCTDDKLQAWGLWQKGERHARDAIRHAVYHMLFTIGKIHIPVKK